MLRLLILAGEPPYPAIHGGQLDTYRRLLALHASGVSIILVYWQNNAASHKPPEEIMSLCDDIIILERRHYRSHLHLLLTRPEWIAQRRISKSDSAILNKKINDKKPCAIFLDGIYGATVALSLKKKFKLPLLYRSHNIEHIYSKIQASRASNWRERILLTQNYILMRPLELKLLKQSDKFFDISGPDLLYWKERGYSNGQWLPTSIDADFATAASSLVDWRPTYEIGYIGNLYAQNNVEGIKWLLLNVIPIVKKKIPHVKIFIAGSRPSEILEQLASSAGVTIIANPITMLPWIRNCKVLVNPIFAGSGVNIKSVEALFSPASLVSTSAGVAGLPADVHSCFAISDNAEDFADHILNALYSNAAASGPDKIRIQAREHFYHENIIDLMGISNLQKNHVI